MRRKRTELPPNEVNIVSLMDILTTLLFFILMVATFSNFSSLDAMALASGTQSEEKKQVFALRVRIMSPSTAQVELGPIDELKPIDGNRFKSYMNTRYKGNPKNGYIRTIVKNDPEQLMAKVREVLIPIKKAFPHENKVVLSFGDKVQYQMMIDAMASVKSLKATEEAFVQKPLVGASEKSRVLFPQVVLGEDS